MFLKKLYHYSKSLFFGLIFFIVLFIYLNYKWGITATPVYQFGMFSSAMKQSDTQKVYHVYIDGRLLDMSKIYFSERDLLLNSVACYKLQPQYNKYVFNTLDVFFSKSKFKAWDFHYFSNTTTDEQFLNWYKKKLEFYSGEPVKKIEIFSQKYLWTITGFVPVSSPQKEFVDING